MSIVEIFLYPAPFAALEKKKEKKTSRQRTRVRVRYATDIARRLYRVYYRVYYQRHIVCKWIFPPLPFHVILILMDDFNDDRALRRLTRPFFQTRLLIISPRDTNSTALIIISVSPFLSLSLVPIIGLAGCLPMGPPVFLLLRARARARSFPFVFTFPSRLQPIGDGRHHNGRLSLKAISINCNSPDRSDLLGKVDVH